MKKVLGLSIAFLFVLTGCDMSATKTMSCTYENTTGNLTSKTNYSIDYIGTEVKKVRVTYDYHTDIVNDTDGDGMNDMDGVGTGTDGTTNDTQIDNDGIIDGVVGSAIDTIINGITGTILDIAGLRDRHTLVQNRYGNITGFSVQNTSDVTDNNYHVTYIIDYDMVNDDDLNSLGFNRNIDILKSNYVSQGFTCK